MNNRNIIQLLAVGFLFSYISCLLVGTNGKKKNYCFIKWLNKDDLVVISYVISGENEEKVIATLSEVGGTTIYHNDNSHSGDYQGVIPSNGDYSLCFLPLDSSQYYISFEFFTKNERGSTLDLAQDQSVRKMRENVNEISTLFESLEKNVKYTMDRRSSHTEILGNITNSIKHLTFVKIGILLLISLLQVVLIQRFFGPNKKGVITIAEGFEHSGGIL